MQNIPLETNAEVPSSRTERVLGLARERGVLRPRDLDALRIPRVYLRRMLDRGLLERIGRGLYSLPEAEVTEHRTLVEASKRVPRGVVCLLSALSFHELTTQNPAEVWMAIDQKAWRPRGEIPPIRIVHMSGPALRDHLRREPGSVDQLWRFAKICRVAQVMRPYLEAIVS